MRRWRMDSQQRLLLALLFAIVAVMVIGMVNQIACAVRCCSL